MYTFEDGNVLHSFTMCNDAISSLLDLQTVNQRVTQKYYKTLTEFIGDVMRIFENCRFFNQPDSPVVKSAECLESFFAQKLVLLRERVVSSSSEN